MKRLTYLALAIVFFVGTAITFDACKKDKNEEPENPTPPTYTNGKEITH